MKPEKILEKVCQSIDVLTEVGAKYEGLFPSIINCETHEMMRTLPPKIDGQRNGDRAHLGGNLMHDHRLLKAMHALSEALHRKDYADAADQYLRRFANHCTNTITGLFPWGEHAFWHLEKDLPGNSRQNLNPNQKAPLIHDHLRQAPVWLWEKLYEYNPGCVERFAEGLNGHWTEGEPLEYIRHAYIEKKVLYERGARSCDFPRHGGFYILDWLFAYLKTGREDFLDQIQRMLDHWWPKRDELGLLLIESRSPVTAENFYQQNSTVQTLSLAVSLLESAELLDARKPEIAERMRERGKVYIEGFLAAPHDIENSIFIGGCRRGTNEITGTLVTWGSKYGQAMPSAGPALIALRGYHFTGDQRLFDWAKASARSYSGASFPEDVAIPARDPGAAIGLLADLYDLTDETVWLEEGLKLAVDIMDIYMDGDLPRGSSKTEVYESQLGTDFLLHSLARIALLAMDKDNCPLEADYTSR